MIRVSCHFAFEVPVVAGHRGKGPSHPCPEIVFTGRSAGWICQTDSRLRYEPDTVFLYQPDGDHWAENEQAGVHTCIGVSGCGVEGIAPGVFPIGERLMEWFESLNDEALPGSDDLPGISMQGAACRRGHRP